MRPSARFFLPLCSVCGRCEGGVQSSTVESHASTSWLLFGGLLARDASTRLGGYSFELVGVLSSDVCRSHRQSQTILSKVDDDKSADLTDPPQLQVRGPRAPTVPGGGRRRDSARPSRHPCLQNWSPHTLSLPSTHSIQRSKSAGLGPETWRKPNCIRFLIHHK